jgi:hypothetical protein
MVRRMLDMVEKTIIGLGAIVLLGLIWLAVQATGKWDECRSKGGYVVELTSGYVCARLDIIK